MTQRHQSAFVELHEDETQRLRVFKRLMSACPFLYPRMVLRTDDLLDQLDSRLSNMQAQLPSNPDTRPLPSGWVEHLDPHRKLWYYIDLGAAQPRATFVHPLDESTNESAHNTPTSPSTSTQSGSSGSTSRPPSRTRVKAPSTPIGSTVCRRATTAQQLYASSLESGSKISRSVLASRESVSSSNTGSNSDPESHVVSTPPERRFLHNHPGRGDSSSRASPITPAFPVHPNSHDPRIFFDITRLSQGARKYRHEEALRSNGTSQTVLAYPPSQSPSPTHPLTYGESSAPANGSTNSLPPTMNTLSLTNDPSSTPATSGPIPSEAQALYNPSVVAKPLSPSRATIVADRYNYSISVPLSGGVSRNVSTERDPKRPQPIQITQHTSDNYKLYTAVTEDETLKIVPNSSSTAYPDASGLTEDNLLVLPSHPTPQRDRHLSPTINVLDVQNPDTPPALHEMKPKSPVRTLSVSRLYTKKKKKSLSVDNTMVLQQPRPVRPLGGLSAKLNDQASGLDPEDTRYYAENLKGKGKERRNYGFSSIFETMDRLANRESGIIMKEYA